MRSLCAAVIALLLFSGCSKAIDGGEDASVRTDAGTYSIGDGTATIAISFTNRTDAELYLGRCGSEPPSYRIEKEIDGGWVSVYQPVCAMILVPEPYRLRSGETYSATITLGTRQEPETYPRFEVDGEPLPAEQIPGTYRLVLDVYSGWGGETPTDQLPSEQTASNPFELTP